jgi:hypothetical protein
MVEVETEIKGCEMNFEVYATVTSGGSNSYGSDEPEWFDVDITDICWQGRKVSDRLWNKIIKDYEDIIDEDFENKYL